MRVRRTLPQRHRSLIGAWCFVDHYGPDEVDRDRRHGRRAAPAHRAADGQLALRRARSSTATRRAHHAIVRPGEVNLMTAGRGISHSEVSTPDTEPCSTAPSSGSRCPRPPRHRPRLRALRSRRRSAAPGWEARVFLGSLLGATLAGGHPHPAARRRADARAPARPSRSRSTQTFEHGVLLDVGVVERRRHRAQAQRPGLRRPGRSPDPDDHRARGGAAAGARRPAVRRGDRHVVELHRPHPRGDRRLPRGVAGADRRRPAGRRPVRRGRPSTCRRSRRPSCPTSGSS